MGTPKLGTVVAKGTWWGCKPGVGRGDGRGHKNGEERAVAVVATAQSLREKGFPEARFRFGEAKPWCL